MVELRGKDEKGNFSIANFEVEGYEACPFYALLAHLFRQMGEGT